MDAVQVTPGEQGCLTATGPVDPHTGNYKPAAAVTRLAIWLV
jgi:hypothetical protein